MDRRNFIKTASIAGIVSGLCDTPASAATSDAATTGNPQASCTADTPSNAARSGGIGNRPGPMWQLDRAESDQPRQVVIILGEAIRYDMLNCNRKTGLKTPNLDRLAEQGIRFTQAYDCQPVCAPARSAVWTGTFPHTNGVWGNSMPMGNTIHSIGERLHDRGIHCGFIGKWHLSGTDYFDTGIPAPGWDPEYWYDMRTYLEELSPRERMASRKPATALHGDWPKEMCYAHRVTNRALSFLEKNKDQEFLLAVAFDEPHDPSLCPREYVEMYKDYVFPSSPNVNDSLADKPVEQRIWSGKELHAVQPPIRADLYFGAHTFVDHEIGRILDEIERVAPNALIIYTADHGLFLESHRLEGKGPAMYQEITHIPFMVKWPGHAPANVASKSLVSHVDIAATMMDYFGFEVPGTLEGCSILPMFKNPEAEVRKEVFIEFGRYEIDHDGFGGFQCIRCICDGRYKLAINLMVTDELYDLESDPAEMHNLIDSQDHASIRNDLHDRLLNWMNTSRDPFRGYYWGRRAWRPDFPETWQNAGMTRQMENDGYLPRELDYATGLTMVDATRPK